ncbi:unnamed protein product [Ectocarpus sp. CCAP 1310/34]|nr:unnamed protein product [Ectocarpus sp. CCAP 1310/34]
MARSLNHLQRGYVPFSGDPAQFEGWVTLTRSLMSEAGLSRVMSGAEIAPAPLPAGATDTQIAGHEKIALKFKEKNGNVYTRLLLATSDGPDGYSSPASQVVQQHGPVGDEEYGDGRGVAAVAAVAAVVDAAAEVMAAELQTVRPVEVGRTATTTTTEPPEETTREMRMADAGMIAGAETLEVMVGLRIPAATVKDVADTAVHNTQDSTTQAWYTRVEAADDELEDFAIVFDNDKQELNAPAVALPRERAAAGDQEQDAAARALPDGVTTHDVPESALPNVRATDDLQEFAEPAAAADLDLTTPPDSPAEKVTELVRGSRPDITHSVMVLAKSMAKPGPRAMTKLKRVLRYLKGTTSIGITYTEDADGGDKLTAYVDSDFAGDQDKGYSTTGAVLYLAGAPVDWISKKQTVLAISTFEAEAVALSKACTIVIHFRNLLKSLNMKQEQPTVVFEDNAGTIAFAKGAKLTPRTKHIDLKYHHVWYLEEKKIVDVKYTETNLQKADILTKSQGAVKFLQNRLLLLGV